MRDGLSAFMCESTSPGQKENEIIREIQVTTVCILGRGGPVKAEKSVAPMAGIKNKSL